jgi:nitrogenase molybdenum-iron protein alpha chain
MSYNLLSSNVPTRENRLGSITGYDGGLKDLVTRSRCGSLKNRERCFSQSSSCLSGCAIAQLAAIRNVAVIYHAPAGCVGLAATTSVLSRQLATRIGTTTNTVIIGTDMDEDDTVFGALDAVRDIVRSTWENYRPEAIFIASSCVSGVIGEDIDSVVDELAAAYGIPVVSVHCEGFKSRIWATGFDVSDHAVLQAIVKPLVTKRPVVNFKNFYESARRPIERIFAEFGLGVQFLYCNSTVEELSHISESLATVCICGTLGTYLGNALEELYGVPYVKSINPLGVAGFEAWLSEIGRVVGKADEVERYIARERAIYLPQIEAVRAELAGLRAVIGMGPGYTYEVARVLQELGIEVIQAAAWHYDYKYDDGAVPPALDYLEKHSTVDIPLSVADQQNFEVLNILNAYKPDLYFSRHPGTTVWAIKQGVAAVFVADEFMIFGYEGTLSFAKTVLDTVRNRSFEKNLAARVKLPYTDWWYRQASASFLSPDGLGGATAAVKEND